MIEGPLYDREGMVVADCDLREGLHAKRWFDAVGHYSREDVLVAAAVGPRRRSRPRRAGGAWCRSRRGTSGRARPRRSCSVTRRARCSSTSSVSKSRWLVGSSSSSRSASEATMAAIAARARWPGLRRSSGRRTRRRRGRSGRAACARCDSSVPAAAWRRNHGQQRTGGGDVLRALRAAGGRSWSTCDLAARVGSSVPSRRRSSVVLPAPLAPVTATRSPPWRVRSTSRSTRGRRRRAARDAAAAVGGGVELEADGRRLRAGARPTSRRFIARSRRCSRACAFFATFLA